MAKINEIFRTYGSAYIKKFGHRIPKEHLKVIDAIINCRTDHYGRLIYECESCGKSHIFFRSCGNRHCPCCQNHKTRQWLKAQLNRQLQGHYFMITFTLPEELRRFIRSNQRACYSAMFHASSRTMKKLSVDEKYIGGDLPGFFGVLHTWGRQLQYHPHIHYIVPGGAISKEDETWHPSRIDFYLPVKAMSNVFRAKFRDEMKRAGLLDDIPSEVWRMSWNVNCRPSGNSKAGIKYLTPYVFKVAISNSRIVKVENDRVTFRYKKQKSRRWRTICLDAMEFIRRFLQHVLPTGFMKIRYYGFMNPNSSVTLDKIRTLIAVTCGIAVPLPAPETDDLPQAGCPDCGHTLIYKRSILPYMIKSIAPG